MIASNELTEQAFQLYKNIFNLSKKTDITRYQEKYFKCLADKCLKRYERRLMKLLGCK
jgi:predicted 3-demethylubiquinone-9 3-methyltransferase (glyoxalase superfamily)